MDHFSFHQMLLTQQIAIATPRSPRISFVGWPMPSSENTREDKGPFGSGRPSFTPFSKYLNSNILYDLSDHQFGFIPGRSCTTQLLYVLDYFTKHLDRGELIDVIYLDFQKAFDSVPHQRLIQKLTSFG